MSRRVPRPCRGGMSCHWVSCGGRGGADGDGADGCAARRCLRSLSCFSRRCRLALPTKQTSLALTLRMILPRGTDRTARGAPAARERCPRLSLDSGTLIIFDRYADGSVPPEADVPQGQDSP